MELHIKNMVCNRCIAAVQQIFTQQNIVPTHIDLGLVKLPTELTSAQLQQIDVQLTQQGFERVDDRKSRVINQLKTVIVQQIHHTNASVNNPQALKVNWSVVLQQALNYDYNYLSSLFSSVEGITIEQYIIKQKIERAKELLIYDELTLSQIADVLDYSSVAHLSAQFKKVTGFTPTAFKNSQQQHRTALDKL